MSLRLGSFALAAAAVLAVAAASPGDAHACGGCFVTDVETTVVSAHRMALSISPAQTVLWDQIQYSGDPQEFAWVLPIKPGARLELSTDAWFEALEAATSARVLAPPDSCFSFGDDGSFGCGCGSYDAAGADRAYSANGSAPPPVTVLHQETVGPYETVTLRSTDPEALTTWLWKHNYTIPEDIQPIIDAYTEEGFDFIALRLTPGAGVSQMKPVRVVSPGATPVLPLRMVAGGTGANVAITLFVIGEGRWAAENFANEVIKPWDITWDFRADSSDYGLLRDAALAKNDGATWLTSFARQGALLSPQFSSATMAQIQYTTESGEFASTIADLYLAQGFANEEAGDMATYACQSTFRSAEQSSDIVVDVCTEASSGGGGAGGSGGGSGTGGAGGSGTGGAGGSGTGGAGGSGTGGAGGSGTGGGGTGGTGGAGGGGTGGAGGGDVVCRTPEFGEIDARQLACGALDDVAVALTGMHPRDVWVTRLEANLPRAALAQDLVIAAAPEQLDVDNWLLAGKTKNDPCAGAAVAPLGIDLGSKGQGDQDGRARPMLIVAFAGMLLAAIARRVRRPAPLTARAAR